MRKQPIVDRVDVVVDGKLVTVAKSIADRWPDIYKPGETPKGNPTAAAKRADDLRNVEPAPITSIGDLPTATDSTAAPATDDTTAGDPGMTTEGVTS
jgi:hypothetical protein